MVLDELHLNRSFRPLEPADIKQTIQKTVESTGDFERWAVAKSDDPRIQPLISIMTAAGDMWMDATQSAELAAKQGASNAADYLVACENYLGYDPQERKEALEELLNGSNAMVERSRAVIAAFEAVNRKLLQLKHDVQDNAPQMKVEAEAARKALETAQTWEALATVLTAMFAGATIFFPPAAATAAAVTGISAVVTDALASSRELKATVATNADEALKMTVQLATSVDSVLQTSRDMFEYWHGRSQALEALVANSNSLSSLDYRVTRLRMDSLIKGWGDVKTEYTSFAANAAYCRTHYSAVTGLTS